MNITQCLPAGFGDITLSTIFDEDSSRRSTLDANWSQYAGWTLPYAYIEQGHSVGDEMQLDYQSTGASAVNHLVNKLATALFNPGQPFFRIDVTPELEAQAEAQGMETADLDQLAGEVERKAMASLDKTGLRTALMTAIRSIVITGNSLLYIPNDDKKAQVYNLRDYVIKRDMAGEAVYMITRDTKSVVALPQELADRVRAEGITDPKADVTIYTGIFRTADNKYVVKQEIEKLFIIPNKQGVYTKDTVPWIPITWNLLRGQDYGNGLVEEYGGSFQTLSTLSAALHNLTAIAADIKLLVNPMGQTDIKTLNESPPGTCVYGNEEDVSYLQLDKMQDIGFLHAQMESIKQEIGKGFLLGSAGTRDAERVTATEIEMNAMELEETLGGVYSRLAEELQQPLATRLLRNMDEGLTELDIQIVTGVDSLSRKSELDQIRLLFQDLTILNSLPPEVAKYLNYNEVVQTFSTHRGIDTEKFLKTEEEMQAEEQRQIALQIQMAKGQQSAEGQAK